MKRETMEIILTFLGGSGITAVLGYLGLRSTNEKDVKVAEIKLDAKSYGLLKDELDETQKKLSEEIELSQKKNREIAELNATIVQLTSGMRIIVAILKDKHGDDDSTIQMFDEITKIVSSASFKSRGL